MFFKLSYQLVPEDWKDWEVESEGSPKGLESKNEKFDTVKGDNKEE